MSPYKPNKPPEHINGFRIGDRVKTPLGRIARIVGLRCDGYIEGEYEGQHPRLASVILQANQLVKV